ncbi:MAG: acyl-CoA dehydrogenase family protein [Aeromicrobium sp.]
MTAVLNEDLDAFRVASRTFLRTRSTSEQVRSTIDAGTGVDAATWSQAANQLGIQGLLVPDELGGSGAKIAVAVTALQEVAATLTPGPYLATTWAAQALSTHGAGAFDDTLRAIAAGTARIAVSWPRLDVDGALSAPPVQLVGDGAALVDGTLPVLSHASSSDHVLLLVGDAGSRHLVLVDLAEASASVETLEALDLTGPTGRVTFAATPAVAVPVDEESVVRLLDLAAVLVAAEQLGLLREVLARDVVYAGERTAFGREIGSFQSVKHQLAEFACLFEQSQAMLDEAVLGFDGGATERSVSAAACAAFVGSAAVQVTTDGLRLLGGIGFTWEHDAHLFYRRARATEVLLGSPYGQRRRLARLLGLTT